jgi:hypothetical protein
MENDYSKEIYEKYLNKKEVLKISLRNGSIVEGKLIGFFHGNKEHDPFIIKWHFIPSDESVLDNIMAEEVEDQNGYILKQEDIVKVSFK